MNRERHVWWSERLGRPMEIRLYGHGGEPVLLFPTSRGAVHQNEDFGLIDAIGDKLAAGRYLVVGVDSVDGESWYNRGLHPRDRIRRHAQYESYVVNEVVPYLRRRASPGRLTLGGCSFGGFHTMLIGLRHPRVFQRMLSMSGKFETEGFLDGFHDQSVYFTSPLQWVPNLSDPGLLDALYKTEIVLATGEHDPCQESNRRLSGVLWGKGIGNHLSVWNGAVHDWPAWRQMIAHYLPW